MAQDYLMRLLQQVAAMLAAIIARRREGQITEAIEEVKAACLNTVGLPLDQVQRMAPDEIAAHLERTGARRHVRAVMLAELLLQDAEMHEPNEPQQALAAQIHAFCLLLDSMDALSNEERAHYQTKLESLASKLEQLPPNPFTTERLSAFRRSRAGS